MKIRTNRKSNRQASRLHWKLYFPLVGMLWLIIGITICYFVMHEKNRQRQNLENRLLNVNNTVIAAYEQGADLQTTVNFIQLFTDDTTLNPLRITVYNHQGEMIADNPEATIDLYDCDGQVNPEIKKLLDENSKVKDVSYHEDINMICSKQSADNKIISLAALPYKGEVIDFLSIDPTIWIVVIILGLLTSALAYIGVHAVCRNVYALRDFAKAIATDELPEDIDSIDFSNDELGDVSRNLMNVYREKIHAEQEKIHHERQLCLNINHELNTPVGIIKGYIDTVVDDSSMSEETRRKFLLRAKQNTDRLAHLVADVTMVMSLDENTGRLQGSPFDFNRTMARMSEDIKQGSLSEGMTFRYDIPAGCMVKGHESLLTNAILNLVYNATKYSGGTEMALEWKGMRDGMHTFTFADNGTGVSREHLGRLFDLFYRVDSGRSRKTGGSGLGLPLVRRIIVAMGGTITVDNVPTGGLIFTFTLPEADAQAE